LAKQINHLVTTPVVRKYLGDSIPHETVDPVYDTQVW